MDLAGLTTVDDWLDRLDDFGMLVGHSTGTTGKLSFVPRSQRRMAGLAAAYNEASARASGVDPAHRAHAEPSFPAIAAATR